MNNNAELSYDMCMYLNTLPSLYTMERKQIAIKKSCGGTTGPKKEKFDCCGTATILLEFEEAVIKGAVENQLDSLSAKFKGLAGRMQSPMPEGVIAAVAFLENLSS